MSIEKKVIIIGFIVIFIVSFILSGYFLPLDILHNFSAYFGQQWAPSKNSLISDPITQFEPWRYFAKQQILSGILPFWNPYNSFGAPFFANPQTAIFFPLNIIYYIFSKQVALFMISFLKLYFLAISSYYYFRQIKSSRFASLFGAVGITFSAFPIVWLLWPHTNVYIFFPLMLFITEKLRNPNANKFLLRGLLLVIFFFALLGGHPETFFNCVVVYFAYSLFRFWKYKNELLLAFLILFLAICLDAFQILPFLQYLFYSSSFSIRQQQEYNYFLPFKSIILDFIPFLLGAPQLQFYKSISDFTNFQETIGGYIGVNALLLSLFGIFTMQKNSLVRIWTILSIICFGISYLIPPFSLVKDIPIIHGFANQRIIGFYGFGMISIATVVIDRQFKFKNKWTKKIFTLSLMILILLLFFLAVFPHFQILSAKEDYIRFLLEHIIYMYFTTVLFIWILISFKKSFAKNFLLLMLLLSQTLVLFWNYNSISNKNEYYPKTSMIEKIQSLPSGTVLEVGNTFLPYNSNIIYGISLAQNYDALEVGSYKFLFNLVFPYLNTVGNVDLVNMDALEAMHIRYVISDFDINLDRTILYSGNNTVLHPIFGKYIYNASFLASDNKIKGIRVLTANFNRKNTCILILSLYQKNKLIIKKEIPCLAIHDHSYLFVPLNVSMTPRAKYTFSFSSRDASEKNSITLIGNKNSVPYFEIFYSPISNSRHFQLLYKDSFNYLYQVPIAPLLTLPGKVIQQNHSINSSVYLINSQTKNVLTIPVVKYPGWQARIDKKPVGLGSNVFLSVTVPKGKHTVSFIYIPKSFYLGLLVSGLTLFGILAIILIKGFGKIKIGK